MILRRAMHEEKWPGRWTVPGGTLEPADYDTLTPNAAGIYYNVLPHLVQREVREETGLEIMNIRFLLDLAYPKRAGKALCLSFFADWKCGNLLPDKEHDDAAWVTIEQAKTYDLIEGIYEELLMVEDAIAGRSLHPWGHYVQQAKKR